MFGPIRFGFGKKPQKGQSKSGGCVAWKAKVDIASDNPEPALHSLHSIHDFFSIFTAINAQPMKHISLPFHLLFGLLSVAFVQAQETQVLRNEVRIRPYLTEKQVATPADFAGQPVSDTLSGRFVRLVRFQKMLSPIQKQMLEVQGVAIEGYIPYQSYLLSFPTSFQRNQLEIIGATHCIRLSAENKMSPLLLAEGKTQKWKAQELVDFVVDCYNAFPDNRIEASLRSLGTIRPVADPDSRALLLQMEFGKLDQLLALPFVKFVEVDPGKPVPDDTRGRSLHRSNVINTDYAGGLKYDGRGVTIGLADDGHVGPHIDFKGRMTSLTTSNAGTHGDMTSGICIGAANMDARYKGMATGAYMYLYDISNYPHVNNAVQNFTNLGTVITSTSYSEGCNAYSTTSASSDNRLYQNRPLMFVFSGGNNATANCGYGAGAGWGNITGGHKNGKNTIATGNVSASGVIDPTSSRGPAPDGRIKPDICANGLGQFSTDENYTYSEGGGTSAACPGLAGITAQLYQAWRELKQQANPEGALIKGIMMATADDLGNAGPDFVYGWGRINARKALKMIEDTRYAIDSIQMGDSLEYTLQIPAGTQEAKIMIYWADPSAQPNSSLNLINNLDLKIRRPDGSSVLPWKLKTTPNATDLNTPASTGIDSLNNMEQVYLNAPAEGTYTIVVKGSSIVQGYQRFYLMQQMEDAAVTLTYPIGGEDFVPGQSELIRWDAAGNAGTFNVAYSADSGQTWTTIANPAATLRQQSWTVPTSFVTGKALIRVTRGASTSTSHRTFSSINPPTNLRVLKACPDSITVAWNAVTGANRYQVYFLGEKYMDSVGVTSATQITLPYTYNQELWYSVGAIFPNGNKGRRAVAVRKNVGLTNCQLAVDVQVSRTLSPATGVNFSCPSFSNFPVRIRLRNRGANAISNIPVSYRLNSGTPVTETAEITLAPGDSAVYQFATGLNLAAGTSYQLLVLALLPADPYSINDSSKVAFTTAAATTGTFSQNFQSATFPPTGWSVTNLGFGTWVRSTGFTGITGLTTAAAKIDNFVANQAGSRDYLSAPLVDLATAGSARFLFDRAYAPRANRPDSLLVEVSTDCGATFLNAGYAKGQAELATAPAQTASFLPNDAADWATDTVDLSPYVGNKVLIRLVSVSRFGNALYIDNARVTSSPVATNRFENALAFNIVPNPGEQKIRLVLPKATAGPSTIRFFAADGRMVLSQSLPVAEEPLLDVATLPVGVYQVLVSDGEQTYQSRFVRK